MAIEVRPATDVDDGAIVVGPKKAGLSQAAETTSVLDGFPRVLLCLDLG